MKTTLLILPGLGDSGEAHWQHHWWKTFDNSQKVVQSNWEEPLLADWLLTLQAHIEELDSKIVLVAHSLSVALVAHWAKHYTSDKIAGAFLVAPSDVDSPAHTPEIIRNFSPIPLNRLPFPSVVVASENDPYVSFERAAFLANAWGSQFVNIGKKGHINSASELGLWPEGQQILTKLCSHALPLL